MPRGLPKLESFTNLMPRGHALICTWSTLTTEEFATKISDLAQKLGEILAEKLGQDPLYPPCAISKIIGLMPHTDSDFLTILHQDNIGGLQLVKDGRWIAVKPNEDALIINIGDLLQAWSNDVYKSVKHRVLANRHKERFSMAYFFTPSKDSIIQSCGEPQVYRSFSFGEYLQQIKDDVKKQGNKIGLPRFIL
ncbi:gibberellin 2-beta-dioxygenase 8-like [Impatiens glandulifera]|uniref:gibberellin 2-beta-dioxygenase 8-like n=1 Tax=Impatiens glandulifera TaxID=253017 RepID=UPI001FB0A8AF|nr:gibberellin 2-beta-dioxygenase 8-like [Impatiens glandulifera]